MSSAQATAAENQRGLSRRSIELLLLLAASPVVILLFVLAILNSEQPLSLTNMAVPLGLFVAFLGSHFALRKLAPGADPALLPICFALSGIGIAFVLRLAPELAGRQVMWLFASIVAMVLTLVLVKSVKKLGDYKYTIIIAGLILLLLPAVVGTEINGSKIWLRLGEFSFQPGEVAKILIALFLAAYLAENREMLSVSGRRVGRINIPDLRTLAPLIVMWGISMVLVVFERDLGSALLFFGIFIVMLYIATGRLSFVLAAVVLAAIGATAAFFLFDHVQQRVDIWLDPFAYSQTQGYQLVQALYSLADGGLIGTGIGRGMPETITFVESDFIFIAIAEEMGFLGAAGVLLLFILFAVRGFTIASRANSDMEAFSAVGLTTSIAFQAFVIVGGTTLLIPLTGVTLPFMSQGGSSLFASFIVLGLLLRISDSGTGHENELQSTVNLDGGVLGRIALGKRLTRLVTIFCLVFALAIGNLAYQMFIVGEEVKNLPVNSHMLAREATAQRGAIVTSDGVTLAESVANGDGTYTRSYPEGDLATHLVGYSSARYGSTGIEASLAEELRGETHFTTWTEVINSFAGIQSPGNDVQLTINSQMQRAAQNALSGYSGAAVVLDAATGQVLAQASSPTYNLNEADTVIEQANAEGAEGSGVLVNRATGSTYSPGSTFKVVTLTAALYSGIVKLTDTYDAPGSWEIDNAEVVNFNGNSYGTITVEQALAYSANTVFAQIAVDIGAGPLVSMAESFGFNHEIGLDFDVTTSPLASASELGEAQTAWLGAGEGGKNLEATVTQMALVASAMANDGTIMNPYVVDSVLSSSGAKVWQTEPEVFANVASSSVIADVNEAMEEVVSTGTGYEAQVYGYTVRGKTGTAESGRASGQYHSWFIGYIEVNGKNIVVAIILEEAGEGASTPRAGSIFNEAVAVYGP